MILAIGIDAAEPSLVRRLIASGQMPSLQALLARGRWGEVHGPAAIGSGAMWPTFYTGTGPHEHGVCSPEVWQPHAMTLGPLESAHLAPFWAASPLRERRIGVFDVPFAPPVRQPNTIEVIGWGPHDRTDGQIHAHPSAVRGLVATPHPFSQGWVRTRGPDDVEGLRGLVADCVTGARLRGAAAARLITEYDLDALLVVFGEAHRVSHLLWHAIDRTHPDNGPSLPDPLEVFRELDRQIGDLVQRAGHGAHVLVFSLHGMRSAAGVPSVLGPLLRAWGYSSPLSAWQRVLRQTPQAAAHDWRHTTAFALPTDQHGRIRVNLAGREARGVVEPARYHEVCEDLEARLRALRSASGERLVAEVVRTGRDAPPARLPDVLVHWTPAAHADPLRLADPPIIAPRSAPRITGQHAPTGFFVCSRGIEPPSASVQAEDLHHLITGRLTARVPSVPDRTHAVGEARGDG